MLPYLFLCGDLYAEGQVEIAPLTQRDDHVPEAGGARQDGDPLWLILCTCQTSTVNNREVCLPNNQ